MRPRIVRVRVSRAAWSMGLLTALAASCGGRNEFFGGSAPGASGGANVHDSAGGSSGVDEAMSGDAGRAAEGARSTEGDGGDAGTAGVSEGGGASRTSPLPLGSVIKVEEGVDCAAQGQQGCTELTVQCPNVEDATAILKITEPDRATRTVAVLGPGGGTAFYNPIKLVNAYANEGFRVVQIKWTDAWEQATTSPSITAAACRPATVFRWVFDHLHQGGTQNAFCVHGSSGGSGAVGYALARYGLKNIFDFAVMSFGPVFSDIQYGCDPALYTEPKPFVCPELPSASFAYNDGNNMLSLNRWEGTSTCTEDAASIGAADIQKWTSDRIDTSDADFDYPRTGSAYYYCVPANSGAGLGAFFIAKAHALSSRTTCFTDCTNTEGVVAADVQQIALDMGAGCTPHHQ